MSRWTSLETLLDRDRPDRQVWTREELDRLVYEGKKIEKQQDLKHKKELKRC